MSRPRSVHAVYNVLNDGEFLGASLRSVYDFVSGITVVTSYDRDRYGRPRPPGEVVDGILSRRLDPERKINLIVTTEVGDPRSRNRAMAFAARSPRIVPVPEEPPGVAPPDLFWHVDADEVYDPVEVDRLLDWVGDHPARVYLLEWRSYFRTWNWRIDERGSFVALSRPGFRFGSVRQWYPTVWARGWARLAREGRISPRQALRPLRARLVPPEVAVCHHGSYVGPRSRIEEKLASSPHQREIVDGWLERVWDAWTPESRDLHPLDPPRFPRATHVATEDLPAAIREHAWPEGWIESTVRGAVAERTAG